MLRKTYNVCNNHEILLMRFEISLPIKERCGQHCSQSSLSRKAPNAVLIEPKLFIETFRFHTYVFLNCLLGNGL